MVVSPRRFAAILLAHLVAIPAIAQFEKGSVRVSVTDPANLPLPSSLALTSDASRTHREATSTNNGQFTFEHLPFGLYHLTVSHPGFTPSNTLVAVHSAIPLDIKAQLQLQRASTVVDVTESSTLIDTHRTGVSYSVGTQQLQEQQSAQPARSLLDLVNDQPGWIFEANAVLHPRGSEYDTLFVVDGVPMGENRSPAYAPALAAANVNSLNVITGNIPAEYGRKLGGIIEVTTDHDLVAGFHGMADLAGGSFDGYNGSLSGTYGWTNSALTLNASGLHTDRYLDPPVLGNFTNSGSSEDLGATYDWNATEADRLHFTFSRDRTSFEVPNENLQQADGQRQDRNAPETMGEASWNHAFSASMLLNVHMTVEDLAANLWSNDLATPVIAAQQRGFRRSYFNTSLAVHHGIHDFNFGSDALYAPVTEALQYQITDPSYFDPGTQPLFTFNEHRLDREQALWAQDNIRLGNLTLSAGLRWDHYSFVVHDHAFSPRLGAAYFIKKADVVFRISYDRAFQTPALENLLLAGSSQVDQLDSQVLRLPIQPSRGNYLEAGFTKGIVKLARLDVSFWRRTFLNYSDDDVFLNTGISFPIAFQNAHIYGVDAKLELPNWRGLSGYISYSNMLGIAQLPVTGGLFLGSDANGILGVNSSFPISQDQRNTARARTRYQLTKRIWIASSAQYGSGLPSELPDDVNVSDLVAQYGQAIVSRVNFSAGRVRPNFSLDFNAGTLLWKHEKSTLRLEGEVENVTNHLNLINFAGLFSGTAVGTPRAASVSLQLQF
jgi:outer membrane cobalamin receptor